jgi:hypothetical protein
VRIYWSRRQAQTRRNIFLRRRPAEEAVVGVGVAGVVVGEDGEKEGMEKWTLTRCGRLLSVLYAAFLLGLRLFPLLEPSQLTQYIVVHFFFRLCTHFTLPVLVLLCIAITTDLSSGKTIFFLKAVVHAKRSGM